jgi:lactoylglutathione lyase
MRIDHIAIWTMQLEKLKNYYITFFGAIPGDKYCNRSNLFESYFLSFDSGARLEIMTKPDIPMNTNDTIMWQHQGINHIAFGLENSGQVDQKSIELQQAGFPILDGPRKTGDGYYEFVTFDPDENRIEVTTKLPG